MLKINNIYNGDCLEILKEIDDESINCCVTSPPYWALRDYGVEGQLGLEPTFEEYIDRLCNIFDEAKRVLRGDGTCWVVVGDTYAATRSYQVDGTKQVNGSQPHRQPKADLPDKSLVMIPFRFAIEMVNRGWILRNTIIWYKPNCMPASVKDRFTVDFEYVFFFVRNKKYWFEQQFEPASYPNQGKWSQGSNKGYINNQDMPARKLHEYITGETRNRRTVWSIHTKPFKEAHFAVFPEDLIEPMIKAGCPENGIVLDPFLGSGTTGLVAKKLNRNWLGIELNREYCKIAYERINK